MRLLSTLAALLFVTPTLATAAPVPTGPGVPAAVQADADVYAVIFFAEWCGACKVLDPNLKPVMRSLADDESVAFVMLDMTDKTTTAASAEKAGDLGLADVFGENVGKTGFVLLVDAESGETIGRIESRDATATIRTKIRDAVAAAS